LFGGALGEIPTYRSVSPARESALFPLFGGLSVVLAGSLSDRLKHGGRATIIVIGLLLSGIALFLLGHIRRFPSSTHHPRHARGIPDDRGPYSYFAGAIALDLGENKAVPQPPASLMASATWEGFSRVTQLLVFRSPMDGGALLPRWRLLFGYRAS
jgi:MFS family permease